MDEGIMAQGKSGAGSGLEGLDEQLSAAAALIALYGRRANSPVSSEAELGVVRSEMGVIRAEILSALARLSKRLQVLQEELQSVPSARFGKQK